MALTHLVDNEGAMTCSSCFSHYFAPTPRVNQVDTIDNLQACMLISPVPDVMVYGSCRILVHALSQLIQKDVKFLCLTDELLHSHILWRGSGVLQHCLPDDSPPCCATSRELLRELVLYAAAGTRTVIAKDG